MKKLYLVDVSSMFFRAFYAIRPLTNPSGLPVNALYGFIAMTVKLFKDVPEILERYHKRFPYILIDEYQDTSPLQKKILFQ